MEIAIISDTHNRMRRIVVPKSDLLVHCGDATCMNSARELRVFNARLARLGQTVLFVPGNHDGLFQSDPEQARSLVPAAIVLIDESVTINGVKFYGSPWHCGFATNFNAFTLVEGCRELSEAYAKIPEDIDVLITHGPAFGILDQDGRNVSRGCHVLRRYLGYRDPHKTLYHVFGHIHDAYGQYFDPDTNIHHINAASVNSRYQPVNPPVTIRL
jgi:Icc-related predicted phosphoesterase